MEVEADSTILDDLYRAAAHDDLRTIRNLVENFDVDPSSDQNGLWILPGDITLLT